jgi:hypothetical protein
MKFVLKDNVSTRKAVSAIFQLEEKEKVHFEAVVPYSLFMPPL